MPARKADAIVVLSGDGETRLDHALQLMQDGWAPNLVLSGGVDNPPFSLTAQTMRLRAIEGGCAPDRIVVEGESQNTREQAANVVGLAVARGWPELLICASPFHMWRAFLTFVKALKDAGQEERIRIIPAPAFAPWQQTPAGCYADRLTMLSLDELTKIEAYGLRGHVASYNEGLEYLLHWEGR